MLQLLAAALVLISLPVAAEPVAGQATVIDGNMLRIERQVYRLHGIDAPERSQLCAVRWQCGKAAADALHNLTSKATVLCDARWTDGQGRIVAACRAGEADLGAELVRRGLAVALKDSAYAEIEASARARRTGIWAGKFQHPAEYRADRGVRPREMLQDSAPSAPTRPPHPPTGEPDSLWLAQSLDREPLFAPGDETIVD